MSSVAHVLAIEDVPGTIREIVGDLEDDRVVVDSADTVVKAESKLKNRPYDLLLVDIMLADDENGGLNVILGLREGRYGEKNVDTPFYVLTGQKASLDQDALTAIPGCLGIEKKLLQHRLLGRIRDRLNAPKGRG
jgi:CheY-like chemotaxis protein